MQHQEGQWAGGLSCQHAEQLAILKVDMVQL
jgi:hypothetical protein